MLLKLAWRNIWRNKRRTIITLAAVSFATLLAIGMRGIQLGTYALNYRTIIEQFTSYVQIQPVGFQENPSLNKSFRYTNQLEKKLDSIPEVAAYTPRIYADGLISYKDVSLGSALFGIEPKGERRVTTLTEKVKEGHFIQSDSTNNIVVGITLLENLKAKIGDTVVVLAQGYDGSLGNQKFIIAGAVKMGSKEFDAMAAFVGLKTAQSLLGMENRINVIAVSAKGLSDAPDVQSALKKKITDPGLTVLLWNEVIPELEQLVEFDNVSGIFFLGILIVIVAFGILNTILMSITERFREFGVELAIGMPQMNLVKLVYLETLLITIFGLIIGNIIGYGINYYIVQHPIVFGGELTKIYEEYGFLPMLQSTLTFSIFVHVSIAVVVISFISSLYPAVKVYRLEPLKGIRYT
jgi:ABC-type lipoprotein release transport system permease subunit